MEVPFETNKKKFNLNLDASGILISSEEIQFYVILFLRLKAQIVSRLLVFSP